MRKMCSGFATLLLVFAVVFVWGCDAFAADKLNLMWGSTSQTSGLYPMNVAMGDLVNKYVGDKCAVTVLETGGTADNFRRMEKGEVQFGQASATDAYMALNAVGVYEGKPRLTKPRFMLAVHPSVYVYVVTARSGINTLAELSGKKYNPGLRGSTTELVSRMVLKSLGITPDYYPGSTGEAVDAIKDRRIIGYTKSASATTPDTSVQDIQTVLDIKVLNFSEEQQAKVKADHPEFEFISVPAEVYKQKEDVKTVGELMGMCVTADLPEDLVYEMTKAILENHAYIEQSYGGIRGQNMMELTAQASVWLHPGTIKYLREKGYEIRPEQIPPEAR
ncbi:MAG: TAXI family TRAP transporter solute-binding subunit [Synergistaceae bacterium]|nr:TAXI family TRAP transporter solute-binding subunit [Synergistaceae bacterium]